MKALNITLLEITRALSEVLEASNTPDEILYAVLKAITSGEFFGFNRAFILLLDDEKNLYGYAATGPANLYEAGQIWEQLARENVTLTDMIQSYTEEKMKNETEKFRHILDKLHFPASMLNSENCLLGKILRSRRAEVLSICEDIDGFNLIKALGVEKAAAVPLSAGEKNLGLILADNFVTRKEITKTTLLTLETFVLQASLSLSRAFLIKKLKGTIETLEKKNREIEEYQKKTLELEKMAAIGDLVYHLAHEFKNPIVVIGGLANAILEDTEKNDKRYPFITAIIEEISKLDKILHDTVQGLRSQLFAKRERVELQELIDREIDNMKEYANSKQIEIDFVKVNYPVYLNLPRDTFANVMENVINNAIEAINSNGKIKIWIEHKGDNISIYIQDTGKGIPAEIQNKIFEPFFTTKSQGSGLGLYNVQQILKALGGKMVLVNSEVNKGTTFEILIPALLP